MSAPWMPVVAKRASGFLMFVDDEQMQKQNPLLTAREVKIIRRVVRRKMPHARVRVLSVWRLR